MNAWVEIMHIGYPTYIDHGLRFHSYGDWYCRVIQAKNSAIVVP